MTERRLVMADREFDLELGRLFAEVAAAPDADGFAARVTGRLDRSWGYRQGLIGGLGIVGGLIGGAQFLGSGLMKPLGVALAQTNAAVAQFSAAQAVTGSTVRGVADAFSVGAGFDTRILMMSIALAVVAGGLFLTRTIREI